MAADDGVTPYPAYEHRDIGMTMPHGTLARVCLRYIEVCAVVLILFLLTKGILPLLLHGSADDVTRSDPPALVERMLYWCFYAFLAVQVLIRPGALIRGAAKCPLLIAMVLLDLLSTLWSIDPTMTLRSTFRVGMVTVFGLYLATHFRSRDVVHLLAAVLAVSAALSIAFGLFLPSYGIAHGVNDGAWQGIYTQKNVFGQMMLFGALIFQSVLGRSRLSRLLGWIGIGVTILLIALSQSVSAFVCFAAVNLTMALLRRFRQRRLRSVFVVVTVCTLCTAALLVSTDRDVALGMVGKDATLTGRTEIWAAVMDRIAERPLLGYGYGAFWLRGSGPGEWVRQAIRWETPHSHNGYLDVAADLGLLGLSILIGALVHAWYRAWQRWRPELGASEDWPLALLLCVLLIDAVQSPLASSDFVWVLVVGVGAAALDELPVPATRRSVEIHRFRKAEVV